MDLHEVIIKYNYPLKRIRLVISVIILSIAESMIKMKSFLNRTNMGHHFYKLESTVFPQLLLIFQNEKFFGCRLIPRKKGSEIQY
jgi:hypothetical protein